MIDVILGILCFNVILIFFKLLEKYKVDNLQAISFNYLTAGILSLSLTSRSYSIHEIVDSSWIYCAVGVGILFIVVFNLLATAAQKIGMAISTVANKMSLVIPVIAAIILFDETVSILKIIGILLALVGVYLTSTTGNKLNFDKKYLGLILIIFFGQGLADVLFNLAEKYYVGENELGIFFCVLFAAAGTTGIFMLLPKFINGTSKFELKNMLWGIALGVPNFLTLWFFFRSLGSGDLESSQVYPIYNIGVVAISAIIGFLIFKEKLSRSNWLGVLLSALAILAIGFGA